MFLLEIAGNAFIGGQHEFFNQAVSDVTFRPTDAAHHSVLVEFNDRLRQVKINGSTAHALAIQNHRQIPHHFEITHKGSVSLAQLRIAIEDGVYVGVSHAFDRADHALVQFESKHLALAIDLHDARENQSIQPGPQ